MGSIICRFDWLTHYTFIFCIVIMNIGFHGVSMSCQGKGRNSICGGDHCKSAAMLSCRCWKQCQRALDWSWLTCTYHCFLRGVSSSGAPRSCCSSAVIVWEMGFGEGVSPAWPTAIGVSGISAAYRGWKRENMMWAIITCHESKLTT